MALLSGIFNLYRRRLDKISADYVSKEALRDYMNDTRSDRLQMHQENLTNLRDIRGSIERVHERIDEVFHK